MKDIALHYVNMVIEGYSDSVILMGEGGMGKTFQVKELLRGHEHIYRSGYMTAVDMLNDLYENKDKLVFYDDMELFFTDTKQISLLKPILWPVEGERVVSYFTTSSTYKAPKQFVVKGRFIFAINRLPKTNSLSLKALLSRSLYCSLDYTHTQKLNILKTISDKKYKGLPTLARKQVYEYLCDITTPATENLSIRTLIQSFDCRLYSDNKWQPMVKGLLKTNERLLYLHDTIGTEPFERFRGYIEKFVLTKRTYYRDLKELDKKMR